MYLLGKFSFQSDPSGVVYELDHEVTIILLSIYFNLELQITCDPSGVGINYISFFYRHVTPPGSGL